jgi:hypothetical protein
MDGGYVYNINVASAVNGCLDMGYPQEKIIVDVLVCGTVGIDSYTPGHTIDNWKRAR